MWPWQDYSAHIFTHELLWNGFSKADKHKIYFFNFSNVGLFFLPTVGEILSPLKSIPKCQLTLVGPGFNSVEFCLPAIVQVLWRISTLMLEFSVTFIMTIMGQMIPIWIWGFFFKTPVSIRGTQIQLLYNFIKENGNTVEMNVTFLQQWSHSGAVEINVLLLACAVPESAPSPSTGYISHFLNVYKDSSSTLFLHQT